MKLKAFILPLILMAVQLKVDLVQSKRYIKPVRDIFYVASQRSSRNIPRPSSIVTSPAVEKTDVIEYYGNAKGQRGVVAVISLNGEVYTVREGEVFSKRYRVQRIFPDRVILRDMNTNKDITVKLKEG